MAKNLVWNFLCFGQVPRADDNGETRVKRVPHGTTFFGRFRVDASDYIVQQYYYDYICRIIGTTETGDDLSSKISA